MLQSLPEGIGHSLASNLPETRKCEICGKSHPVGDSAVNAMIAVRFQIGSPGHPGVPPFQCPYIEHWTCSVECFEKAAEACLKEHIVPILKEVHSRLGR